MLDRIERECSGLKTMLDTSGIGRDSESSWRDLRPTLLNIIERLQAKHVLEIGGGRSPFLTAEDLNGTNCDYAVNDIDSDELLRAPKGYSTRCFDVAKPLPDSIAPEEFDFIFSRMVFEHVKDGRMAWENVYRLLTPGGVGFAYVPTLYSPPFVINALMPEALSSWALRLISKDRTHDKEPKFPAYYHMCRASQDVLSPALKAIGFREVVVIPFFGTPYFPVVPVLKHAARHIDRIIERYNMTRFASYAYIIAMK